jgi:hypothetical protein
MPRLLLMIAACYLVCAAVGQEFIHPKLLHLRNEPEREWSSFPEKAESTRLECRFEASANKTEQALRIRQQDVKQVWRILLNDKPLGELIRDEADITWYLPIPPAALKDGQNILRIEAKGGAKPVADDIRVGELRLETRAVRDVLSEAMVEIEVRDAATSKLIPARITIASASGSLHATSAVSSNKLAVRPGVIYTADGQARFGLPAGKYTIYAGRGFEYSLAKTELTLNAGQSERRTLSLRREVSTPGYVACDTHIHTLTHSGHGDATIDERMITLAGEGIELPIATDHNVHIDYRSHAERLGVNQHFTPVMGNEFTTSVGHFNIFPIDAGARVANPKLKEWGPIFDEIFATQGAQVAILNHARDIHSGVRPFGPERFNATVGENFLEWPMRFNAMEVINSGATQTDPLQLTRDWMALLNRGYQVTPVGSSDSHDVSRYIVGQGRTYIRCNDADVSQLNADEAIKNFLAGRVVVSYGLFADLILNGVHKPGDLAAIQGDEIAGDLKVLGPHWTTAEKVQLYSNGRLIREEPIRPSADQSRDSGVQWQGSWKMTRPTHDVHFVMVALGKGIEGPYWATAKPYQPASEDFTPTTFSVSGALWLDGDGDGKRSSAYDYALRLHKAAGDDLAALIKSLAPYDQAIAAQATHLHLSKHGAPEQETFDRALAGAPAQIAAGASAAWKAWREQELARAKE